MLPFFCGTNLLAAGHVVFRVLAQRNHQPLNESQKSFFIRDVPFTEFCILVGLNEPKIKMSQITHHLAKHFREVHFGGNWTWSNLKNNLEGLTWQQATTQVHNLNSIAVLVFHVNYYVSAVIKVFQGEPINANDKYSFDLTPITSQEEWEVLIKKALTEAEQFAKLVEELPEHKLWENLADEKYGTICRNILGIIEHTHYHLGQIAVIKKIILHGDK